MSVALDQSQNVRRACNRAPSPGSQSLGKFTTSLCITGSEILLYLFHQSQAFQTICAPGQFYLRLVIFSRDPPLERLVMLHHWQVRLAELHLVSGISSLATETLQLWPLVAVLSSLLVFLYFLVLVLTFSASIKAPTIVFARKEPQTQPVLYLGFLDRARSILFLFMVASEDSI